MKKGAASDVRTHDRPDGAELFGVIAELDARFRALGSRLPGETPPAEVWAGILFRVCERLYLAPLQQVAEVLEPFTELTAIPGTRPWLLGVANNRGTLLPIVDLAALVYGAAPARRDSDRVLAVRQNGLPCGLLVSEVIGIRHFETAVRTSELPSGLGALAPFADSAFPLDGQAVVVLALDRLLADPLLSAGGL
jgi:twitching motility protein PilI